MSTVIKILRWIGAICCIGLAVLLSLGTTFVTIQQLLETRRTVADAHRFGYTIGTLIAYGLLMAVAVGLCLLAVRLIKGKKKQIPVIEEVDVDRYLS